MPFYFPWTRRRSFFATSRTARRIAVAAIAGGTVAVAAALAAAPYLPALVWEGYPSMTWPAHGHFVTLDPNTPQHSLYRSILASSPVQFDERGRGLFTDSGGRALLIYHDGALRFEHYGDGYQETTRLNSYSVVKSLVGLLVVKAHDEGLIKSLSDPVGAYLSGFLSNDVANRPISSFLTMRSGVVFEASGAKGKVADGPKDVEDARLNPFGPMIRLHMRGPTRVVPGLRIDPHRADVYDYQNINTSLLGLLVETIYQRPLEEVLHEKIWEPAGAGQASWRLHGEDGPATAYCCLFATPLDWLKIGVFLIENGGTDAPFLSERLWDAYFRIGEAPDERTAYGWHAYHDVLDREGEDLQGPFTYFFGRRGQTVYMMPEQGLVVVRFGRNIQLLHSTLYASWRTIHPPSDVLATNLP